MKELPELNKLFTVVTPDAVSDTGIERVCAYLLSVLDEERLKKNSAVKWEKFAYSFFPEDWSWNWVLTRGKYAGTLPKRIDKFFAVEVGLRLGSKRLSEIGNIARNHSLKASEVHLDITDCIDWYAGDFGDSGSCYWGDHAGAREMLTENGGLAIRLYRNSAHSNNNGCGRAWLLPPDSHRKGNFYIVYNGYGGVEKSNGTHTNFETQTFARLISEILACSYKQVGFTNNDDTCGTLYINSGVGYIVGDLQDIEKIERVNMYWPEIENGEVCSDCGYDIDEDDVYWSEGGNGPYCHDCYYERYTRCYSCNEEMRVDYANTANDNDYCDTCYSDLFVTCSRCGEVVDRDDIIYIESSEEDVCEYCADRYYTQCDYCNELYRDNEIREHELTCEDRPEEEVAEAEQRELA